MKFLVTGGSGFIGTNLINFLLKLGHEVLNVDIENPQEAAHINLFKKCDIRELDCLSTVFNTYKPDYVIHLAARTDLNGSALNDYDSNILGVKNICLVCEKTSSIKKVFFASSMLVCKVGYVPSTISEFCPTTFYGESKVIGEKIIRNFEGKLPSYVIARPTSIWGPWFKEPYRNFFDMVLQEKFLDIGPKLCTKTYGYVENICGQIISLTITKSDVKDSLVYLGDKQPLKIRNWANDIATIAAIRTPLQVPFWLITLAANFGDLLDGFKVKFPITTFRLKNMTTDHIIDCSLACKENQFDTQNYNESISRTINWLNKNR